MRAETASTCFSSRETSCRAAVRIWLQLMVSRLHLDISCPKVMDSRSLNVAESRSLHLKVPVALACGIANLAANVFALSITIGPDDEVPGASRLGFNVLGDI